MNLSHLSKISVSGQGLNVEERVAMKAAILKARGEGAGQIQFWGKIFGKQRDYLICCSTDTSTVFPSKNFFYSTTGDWELKKLIKRSMNATQLALAQKLHATYKFQGDPAKPLDEERKEELKEGDAIDLYGADNLDCDGNCLNDSDGDLVCDEDEIVGCQEEDACNYDATATDAGTCDYPLDLYGKDYVDCDGVCLNDADGDLVCDEDEVEGCTDEIACNFIPEAGSCSLVSFVFHFFINASLLNLYCSPFIFLTTIPATFAFHRLNLFHSFIKITSDI